MYTFTYNSVNLHTTYGWELVSVQRRLLSRIRQSVTSYGEADGAAVQGGYRDATVLSVVLHIADTSYANVESELDTLRHILDTHEEKSLLFSQWTDRYWMGKLDGDIEWEELEGAGVVITLQFICSKPFAFASSLTSLPFTINSSPDTFQVAAESVAKSSADIEPVFILQADASVGAFQISNDTTGEVFTFAMPFTSGQYVKVDTEKALVYWSADGVTYSLALTRKAGTYPRLARRVDNDFTITGFSGTLTVQFREVFAS